MNNRPGKKKKYAFERNMGGGGEMDEWLRALAVL